MRNSDRLAQFVEVSLEQQHSREQISETLSAAGWSASEIAEGLGAWAETKNSPPIPRPMPYVSAKESFLYALTFVSLAMTAFHINWLGFELIELMLPGANDWGNGYGEVRWAVSALIVFLPIFLFMNFRVLNDAGKDPARRRSTVRKWFGYVTLFIAAVVLAVDLIVTLNALLSGEMTLRFILKAGLLGTVAALVFVYFRGEMQDAEE